MTLTRIAGLGAAVCALLLLGADSRTSGDRLWEYRNLGKAFYENPDTHAQAVEELQKALEVDPNSARERLNYGLALLRAGQTDAGVAELLKVQAQDAGIPHTWFNLGIAYKHAADYDKAIQQFRGMIRLVPNEPAGHYNLAAVLRSKGEVEGALPEFLEAAKLNPSLAGPHFQLFTLYQRLGKKEEASRERQAFEEAKKRDEGAAVPENMEWCFYAELYDPPEQHPSAERLPTRYDDHLTSKGWLSKNTEMMMLDVHGSGEVDLLVWSPERVALFSRGTEEIRDSGLENLHGVLSIAAGDYDNDGLPDLCVLTAKTATILHNDHGKFSKHLDIPTGGATHALWLDYDHDYDLDLLLFGPNPRLMRNDGSGEFEDKTAAFPFIKGQALDAALFAVRGDTAAQDVLVSYADRPGVLYRDKLSGRFEACDLPELTPGSNRLAITDVNRDGLLDITSYSPVFRTLLNSAPNDDAPAIFKAAENVDAAAYALRADFNGDGREDYAQILPGGSLHIYTNASPAEHWVTLQIHGVKNLKQAVGATVEMKSGAYYEKRVSQGYPLSFPLDGRADVDTIRITWPNGLIQNEPRQKPGALLNIAEAQRLSGSCPMIFAWNGKGFQFISDILGVAPLGASSGDGRYFPVDHDEYVQIPGTALQPVNGKYKIHITEELHEVSYLDQVQLVAVDHPSNLAIYTNDKFKSPPYPEFRLYGSSSRLHPVHAFEGQGIDIAERVAKEDGIYPHGFTHNTAGVAKIHTLDLDFGNAGPENRAALVLKGWVDWADGSTFLAAAQNGKGLIFPYLQVRDAAGNWRTVVRDMGIPSGKPKAIVVDLTGKFLSRSREVRIVTNLCVYWDEIFLIPNSVAPEVKLTRVTATQADLRFRGFSEAVIDPTREQPERFRYDQVESVSNWNPTPGKYTRYGAVETLLTVPDDRMVVMGSGDELALEFPVASLPALHPGWSRDFLLLVDGWAKDSDANTAFSQSVSPLPFHAMSAYPYRSDESFPNDPVHQQYLKEFETRPALRLIRSLAPVTRAE